jgi:hypothetical protein
MNPRKLIKNIIKNILLEALAVEPTTSQDINIASIRSDIMNEYVKSGAFITDLTELAKSAKLNPGIEPTTDDISNAVKQVAEAFLKTNPNFSPINFRADQEFLKRELAIKLNLISKKAESKEPSTGEEAKKS